MQAICQLFTAVLPDRIRAVYLVGSRTERSPATISDINGCILFKDIFIDGEERTKAETVLAQCKLLSPIRLDFGVVAEGDEKLRSGIDVRLKMN